MPRYYERDATGLPKRWLEMMKASMATTVWQFSTSRMLQEYVEQLYLPAAERRGAAAAANRPAAGAADGVPRAAPT